MPYSVYILYSPSLDLFYKGQTSDLKERMKRHNAGLEKATKSGRPWRLVWATEKQTRAKAIGLEAKLKNLGRQRLTIFMQKYKEGVVGPDDPVNGMSGC